MVGTLSAATFLDIYGKSGGYVYARPKNSTAGAQFLWADGLVFDRYNGAIDICKSGATADKRKHWDIFTGNTVALALSSGASATWTTSNAAVAKVNNASSATGATVTINTVAAGTAYITATTGSGSSAKKDVIHVTVISPWTARGGVIKSGGCTQYKCSHLSCTVIDRKGDSITPGNEVVIYGESGDFYYTRYTNSSGQDSYTHMWKDNIEVQTWTKQSALSNLTNGTWWTQGFAVDKDYCYSFEILANESAHRLYRKNMTNSSSPENKSGSGGKTVPALLHANDAAMASYTVNGVTHDCIFVTAFSTASTNYLVQLEYDGNGNYWEVVRFTYSNGLEYAGVANVGPGNATGTVELLLKSGTQFFTVDVGYGGSNRPISPSKKFSISISGYTNYSQQGIHYENDKLYFPLYGSNPYATPNPAKANENVLLVYNGIGNAIANKPSNPLIASNTWTIKKGSDNNVVFEIEGIGFRANPNPADNRLWFNTNEGTINSAGTYIPANGGIYTDSQAIK